MGFHTFDSAKAEGLEDTDRFRFCSREELVQFVDGAPDATVLDLGSGTGFYTDEIAPFVGRVVALDLQPAMHGYYQEKGTPDNVDLVTADAESLPFAEATADAAFSTMTFHEMATDPSLEDLYRVLVPGGRFVAVDWSESGRGDAGPPRAERFDAVTADRLLSKAGFDVLRATERVETFVVVAER